MKKYISIIFSGLVLLYAGIASAAPSSDVAIECGDILEDEFTKSADEHKYRIKMSPGDELQVTASPIGDYLAIGIYIKGPSGMSVSDRHRGSPGTVSVKTKKLSGRGEYEIYVTNIYRPARQTGYMGLYALSVGCVLRNGTVIGN